MIFSHLVALCSAVPCFALSVSSSEFVALELPKWRTEEQKSDSSCTTCHFMIFGCMDLRICASGGKLNERVNVEVWLALA